MYNRYWILNYVHAVRHVWVELDGMKLDIGYEIAVLHHPILSGFKRNLSLILPRNIERIDQDTIAEKNQTKELENGINIFKRSISGYVKILERGPKLMLQIYKDLV